MAAGDATWNRFRQSSSGRPEAQPCRDARPIPGLPVDLSAGREASPSEAIAVGCGCRPLGRRRRLEPGSAPDVQAVTPSLPANPAQDELEHLNAGAQRLTEVDRRARVRRAVPGALEPNRVSPARLWRGRSR